MTAGVRGVAKNQKSTAEALRRREEHTENKEFFSVPPRLRGKNVLLTSLSTLTRTSRKSFLATEVTESTKVNEEN